MFCISDMKGLLNCLLMSLFCSIVRVGTRKSWIFSWLVKVDPCAAASLLVVLKNIDFGCRILFSFRVGMYIIFDSAPESIKKYNSRSGVCNCLDFGLSRRSGIVQIFSLCNCGSLGMF